jgi:hypothetical protein
VTAPDPGHAARIARTELVRGWRNLRGRGLLQQVVLGAGALFWTVFVLAAGAGGYAGGQALLDGTGGVTEVRSVPAGAAALVFAMTAYLTGIQMGEPDLKDGLLTTVPHADVVGGLFLVGAVRVAGLFLSVLLGVVAGFAVAVGPVAGALTLAATVLAVGAAYAVGYPVGLAARYLLGQSAFVARHKRTLGALAFLAYMGVLVTGQVGQVTTPVVSVVRNSPVGWFADLALLGTLPGASPLRAGGALLVGALAVPAGFLAAVRVAEPLWYGDGVEAERSAGSVRAGWLLGVLDRPTAWVVRKSWLRARRAPIKLVYVTYPAFALVAPVQSAIEAGRVTATFPPVLALYGAWATGAAFTLNPLGDEGAVLPVTVTTPVGGRRFVRGLAFAGAAVGLPVTVALTLALGAASPLSAGGALAIAAAAGALCAGAPLIAAGVGSAFPKYEAANVSRSREVVVPSAWGFVTYSAAVLFAGAPAVVVGFPPVTATLADAAGVPATAVRLGGVALTVVLVAAGAVVSRRHAVRAFESYSV